MSRGQRKFFLFFSAGRRHSTPAPIVKGNLVFVRSRWLLSEVGTSGYLQGGACSRRGQMADNVAGFVENIRDWAVFGYFRSGEVAESGQGTSLPCARGGGAAKPRRKGCCRVWSNRSRRCAHRKRFLSLRRHAFRRNAYHFSPHLSQPSQSANADSSPKGRAKRAGQLRVASPE